MQRTDGLTLIEILIAMTLALVVLSALYALMTSTTQANATLTTRAQLISEANVASSILNARLREACGVFAQNTSITLPATIKGTKKTTDSTWKVGADPFIALVVPPSATTPGSTPMFYAYYLLPRAQYIAQMSAQQAISSSTDTTSQVLMEFKAPISTASPCDNLATLTTPGPLNAEALLLAEYVRSPTTSEPIFTSETDRAITYILRFQKPSGTSVTVLPSLNQNPIRASIVGRNIR